MQLLILFISSANGSPNRVLLKSEIFKTFIFNTVFVFFYPKNLNVEFEKPRIDWIAYTKNHKVSWQWLPKRCNLNCYWSYTWVNIQGVQFSENKPLLCFFRKGYWPWRTAYDHCFSYFYFYVWLPTLSARGSMPTSCLTRRQVWKKTHPVLKSVLLMERDRQTSRVLQTCSGRNTMKAGRSSPIFHISCSLSDLRIMTLEEK